jgi:competence protein ComEC
MGDIERQIEQTIEGARADVLKVAHHGSKTSSTEELLDRVHPAFALISAGFENSYGHPHRDVTERLSGHHAAVLRTDRDGLISIHSDGRRLTVESYSGFFSQR